MVQEGTFGKPDPHSDTNACRRISDMLARFSDKWSLLIIRALDGKPMRFNALRREIGNISQKMLASTLRDLEENGFVTRTVTPTTPPQVEYALTALGRSSSEPVQALATWILANADQIDAARTAYATRVRPD